MQPSNMPMVSEVSICNQALTWLGQSPIISLNDPLITAEWMRNNYPFIRDTVLSEREWTFATKRDTWETADLDAWGNEYVYNIPAEWLGIYRVFQTVNSGGGNTLDYTWRREGQQVLSKWAKIYVWGTIRVSDTGQYSMPFVQALAARLAADAAIPLTENRQLQADLWALYGDKLREAAARDGQQGMNDKLRMPILTGVRYGGGIW